MSNKKISKFLLLFIYIISTSFPTWGSINEEEKEPDNAVTLPLFPIKMKRDSSQYLEECKKPHRILVIGGTRSSGYPYPPNAFLLNNDQNDPGIDLPVVDITRSNNFPKDLEKKFDAVVWECVDSGLFLKDETFETIKKSIKEGGVLVSNNMLCPPLDLDTFFNVKNIIKNNKKLAEKNYTKVCDGLYVHKVTSISYFDKDEYKGNNIVQEVLNKLYIPHFTKHKFKSIINNNYLVKDTPQYYWYRARYEDGYFIVQYKEKE